MMSLQDTEHFDRTWFAGDVYVDKDKAKWFTALRITVHGKHPKKQMKDGTTRTYFVVSGTWSFTLDGQTKQVAEGDFFVIEPGHQYEYEGTMVLFETNISPNNIFKDELLETLTK